MTTGETQLLLDKAHENVLAAELLRREGFVEIAASRAYYAMFYAAEALLLERVGQLFASHSAVIAAFGREFAKTQQLDVRLHRYLIDTQELRHSGDYTTGVEVTADEVDTAIERAKEFIAAAEDFLTQKPTGE